MKKSPPIFSATRCTNRVLGVSGAVFLVVAIVLVLAAQMRIWFWSPDRNYLSVGITGVHHMGSNFSISEFYINGYSGSNVGREGGGGSNYCCVMLPERWRIGLVAELRWSVADWSKAKEEEIRSGIFQGITWQCFKAYVPIEKYSGTPGQMYVHFFFQGRVRIVSSDVGPGNVAHPIQEEDPAAFELATKGFSCDKQ